MAPQVGLEPTTLRLTAGCSAIELLRSVAAGAAEEQTRGCHEHDITRFRSFKTELRAVARSISSEKRL